MVHFGWSIAPFIWRCKDMKGLDDAVYPSMTSGACGFTNGKALLMNGKRGELGICNWELLSC